MEKSTGDMRLVSKPRSGQGDPGLSTEDLDAARVLAEFHQMLAAELPPHSQLRGLMLRCGSHWSRLGAIPRYGLHGLRHSDED
jgi:hypothetical protein